MNGFSQLGAQLYCRGGSRTIPKVEALAVVAHSDDAEILAVEGIIRSWTNNEKFGVLVVNDGVGRPRAPAYEPYTDSDMADLRIREQFAAARAGDYALALALGHPSSSTKGQRSTIVTDEIMEVIERTKPRVVYTHNPWDEHPSHIAVMQHYLWAQRKASHQPERLFGGEVWGPIDRIPEPYLVRWDCSGHEERLEELLTYFASQNAIKAYNRAVMSRRQALAKLNDPHVTLQATAIHLGVDLTSVLNGEITLRKLIDRCDEIEHTRRIARFVEE